MGYVRISRYSAAFDDLPKTAVHDVFDNGYAGAILAVVSLITMISSTKREVALIKSLLVDPGYRLGLWL